MNKIKKIKSKISDWAGRLKKSIMILYLAYKDKRTPWYVKVLAVITVGYALSPIDLIPDFIPILGYIDDAIILPGLIWICFKIIPDEVKKDSIERARDIFTDMKPKNYAAGAVVILIWLSIIYLIINKFL